MTSCNISCVDCRTVLLVRPTKVLLAMGHVVKQLCSHKFAASHSRLQDSPGSCKSSSTRKHIWACQCAQLCNVNVHSFAVSLQRSQMRSNRAVFSIWSSKSNDIQHQRCPEAVIYHLAFSCQDLQPPCLDCHGLLKSSICASVFWKIWVEQLQHSRILNISNCT